MQEPTILCPKCKSEIKLTESLAAPLVESTRQEYERRIAQQNLAIAEREQKLKSEKDALAKQKEEIEKVVAQRIQSERATIAADESRKAKLALSDDLNKSKRDLEELQTILKDRNEKLVRAQKVEEEALRKQRAIEDERREMNLTIEKRIQEGAAEIHVKAQKAAEERLGLKVAEKELLIASLQTRIDELGRKIDQGSQQAQGEVLELQLESLLRTRFSHDIFEPVPKGEHGGDLLQRVVLPTGAACGTILWECKRTKNWSDSWLPKLREDQRSAKADVAVIVSSVLPKTLETFDCIDNVWITHPRSLIPVAYALRETIVQVNCARQTSEGQQTKMELMYQYLTGPKFKLRVQAIVEAFTTMHEDLLREKKAITKQWAKREEQIANVITATVGMYGELQGIAGKSLAEIDGLGLNMLSEPDPESPMELPARASF